jgi:hypothetical protein
VIAAVVPIAILTNSNGGADKAPPVTSTTSPEPPPAPPKVITFPGNGIFLTDPSQVDKLEGTSPAFKSYIAGKVRAVRQDTSCPDAARGVDVTKYSTAGYAIGGVNECGGYAALWVDYDGVWQEGYGTQDTWDCDTLGFFGVPLSFVGGDCANESGDFGPTEVQQVKLGMTEAEIVAVGGKVTASPGGESCRGVLLPYQEPVPNRSGGSFSPSRGLVGITARPGMKTPERIGLGSTLDALKTAYPTAQLGQDDIWVAPLPGNTEYDFQVGSDGTVTGMTLTMTNKECLQ